MMWISRPIHHLLLLLLLLVVVAGTCLLCVDGASAHLLRPADKFPDAPQDGAFVAMSGAGASDPSEEESGSAGGGGGGAGGPVAAVGARHRATPPGERSGRGVYGSGEGVRGRERREVEADGETPESLAEAGVDQSGPPTPYTLASDSERSSSGASVTEGNVTATATSGATTMSPPASPTRPDRKGEPTPVQPSPQDPSGAWTGGQRPGTPAPIPGSSLLPSLGASPFPAPSDWEEQDGATAPVVPDLLLVEVGPDAMPRPGGPESLWAEAGSDSAVATEFPLSQDPSTEGTMSSEVLPLIFDPFDDDTPQGATPASAGVTAAPGSPQAPVAATVTDGTLPETDADGPSHPSPVLMPKLMSPWQTSGTELLQPSSSQGPAVPALGPLDQRAMEDSDQFEKLEEISSISPSLFSSGTPVTKATHRHVSKSNPGLEEMESEEESDEDDSEEEQTNTPASNRPPYSLIPPPPVWVQQNQGLMRSWMELIREKAGYVSGMLVPVGIGIAGAILIVGALNSIRMIHRRRQNSFKYQRRKVRQQEVNITPQQPRETGPGRPDQAMLLADSSEDEF